MEITVLGNSSRYLVPLGAGTSYLLRSGETRILLDAGNGTHLRLAEVLSGARLDAVVVSHFHLDNASDLLPVIFSLVPGTPVFLPQRARARIGDVLRAFGMDRSWVQNSRLTGVGRGATAEVRGVRLAFAPTHHGCPGVAMRAEAGGRTLAYLGDTGARPWLADFARGSDLLVAHTLLLDKDAEGDVGEKNLSAGAAARLAAEAGARRLALSHVPFYLNARASVDEAREHFAGEVVVLQEGETYSV